MHDGSGTYCGTAFQVAPTRFLTCGHVAALAGRGDIQGEAQPGDVMELRSEAEGSIDVKVISAQSFSAPGPGRDIALLGCEDDDAPLSQALTFSFAATPSGTPVKAFGFRSNAPDGLWPEGLAQQSGGQGWLQVDDRPGGVLVRPGLSGSPVFAESGLGVIGMLTCTYLADGSESWFLIPSLLIDDALPPPEHLYHEVDDQSALQRAFTRIDFTEACGRFDDHIAEPLASYLVAGARGCGQDVLVARLAQQLGASKIYSFDLDADSEAVERAQGALAKRMNLSGRQRDRLGERLRLSLSAGPIVLRLGLRGGVSAALLNSFLDEVWRPLVQELSSEPAPRALRLLIVAEEERWCDHYPDAAFDVYRPRALICGRFMPADVANWLRDEGVLDDLRERLGGRRPMLAEHLHTLTSGQPEELYEELALRFGMSWGRI